MTSPSPAPVPGAGAPWWRFPIVWLVIGGPLAVVLAGIVTAWLAIDGADISVPATPVAQSSRAAPALAAGVASLLKTVPGIGTIAGGVIQGLVQAVVTRWIGRVFCQYFRSEMQPPAGGLAELARQEWEEITRPDKLRKLVQMGRERLSEESNG